ncbi:MAG: hypothetical protein U0835_00970 [Isosphaeraceae bacterium]
MSATAGAVLGVLGLLATTAAAARGQALTSPPALVFPDEYPFAVAIAPGLTAAPAAGAPTIARPDRFTGLALGPRRTLAWLESSVSRTEPPSGCRVVELSFAGKEPAFREVQVSLGQPRLLQAADGLLSYQIFGKPAALKLRYSEATGRFEPTTNPPARVGTPGVAARPGQGRRYRIDAAERPGGLRTTTDLTCDPKGERVSVVFEGVLTFGEFSAKATTEVPLGMLGEAADGAPFAKVLARWLSETGPNDSAVAPVAERTEGLLALWFKEPVKRVLAIDLDRLRRTVLIRLLAAEQEALNTYDFAEKDFGRASRSLGRIALIQRLVESLSGELGEGPAATITTALASARERLEGLVFRLPARVDGRDWLVFYNAGKRKARLLPALVDWRPVADDPGRPGSGVPLQLKVKGRPLVFLFRLEPSPRFAPAPEVVAALRRSLAETYQDEGLLGVRFETGLPEAFAAGLALGPGGGGSARVELCRRDGRDRLLLKLSATEIDALTLVALYLGKDGAGLPIDLAVDQWFVGGGATAGKPSATIRGRVFAPDLKLVDSLGQKSVRVNVWVDEDDFKRSNVEKIELTFRYPGGEPAGATTIDRAESAGIVELPVTTRDGEFVRDLEYRSPLTGRWVSRPGAADGLILIDE